jgi:hypothetical protein
MSGIPQKPRLRDRIREHFALYDLHPEIFERTTFKEGKPPLFRLEVRFPGRGIAAEFPVAAMDDEEAVNNLLQGLEMSGLDPRLEYARTEDLIRELRDRILDIDQGTYRPIDKVRDAKLRVVATENGETEA